MGCAPLAFEPTNARVGKSLPSSAYLQRIVPAAMAEDKHANMLHRAVLVRPTRLIIRFGLAGEPVNCEEKRVGLRQGRLRRMT